MYRVSSENVRYLKYVTRPRMYKYTEEFKGIHVFVCNILHTFPCLMLREVNIKPTLYKTFSTRYPGFNICLICKLSHKETPIYKPLMSVCVFYLNVSTNTANDLHPKQSRRYVSVKGYQKWYDIYNVKLPLCFVVLYLEWVETVYASISRN